MAELQPLPQTGNDNLTSRYPNDNTQIGPSVPGKARSIVDGTSTGASNDNLVHVCDITGNMKYSIALVSLQIKELIESIRQAIQALFNTTSSSPFTDGIRTVVGAIQAKVKLIQKLIQKAKEVEADIQGYIVQLQQLIAYIASVPAKVAKFLKECLSEATASIRDAITNAQTIVSSQSNGILNTATGDATLSSIDSTTKQNQPIPSSDGANVSLA